MNNSSNKVRASPNQVLGSNTRSFDRRTNQTASRDVNPPTKFEKKKRKFSSFRNKIEKINIRKKKHKVYVMKYQAAPRTETPMAMAMPMAEKV